MKTERLVSIIMILLDKKKVRASELSELFEVSVRTIYRDIDAICMAGIPIRSTSGTGGGFEIMPQFKLDKNVFSSDDLSALLMGLSGLTDAAEKDAITGVLAKLRQIMPSEQADEIELRANRLCIDQTPWLGNRNIQPFLQTIRNALRDNRILSFSYINLKGQRTLRKTEPYRLVLKNSHWYFQGYCLEKEEFRLFKLSRMQNLLLTNEIFLPKEAPKPILQADAYAKPLMLPVTLRIHFSLLERLLDYCPFEEFRPEPDDFYLVEFPFIENNYYYDLLLSFGPGCECLSPPSVREELHRRILELEQHYRS